MKIQEKNQLTDNILDSISRQLLLAIEKIEKKGVYQSNSNEVDCNILNIANDLYLNNLLSGNTSYQKILLEKMEEMRTTDYILKQKRKF